MHLTNSSIGIMSRAVSLLASVVVMTSACAADSARQYAPTVRDSSGITIVDNARSIWGDQGEWSVESSPAVQIGAVDGEAAYNLSNVVDAQRLSDGVIAIADGGSSEIRFFGPDGRHLSTIGRAGSGPGEFRVIAGIVAMPGDSLVVLDPASRRISIVHHSVGFTRTVPWPQEFFSLMIIGFQAPSSILTQHVSGGRARNGDVNTVELVRIPLDGSEPRIVARLPDLSRQYFPGTGPHPTIAGAPAGYWFGKGDVYELARYDAEGHIQRLARVSHSPVPVSSEMIERWKAHDARIRAQTNRPASDKPFPESLPAVLGGVSDADGNLWVRPSRTDNRPIWNIIDSEGRYLWDVELTNGFVPFQTGSDYVLTREWDDYQVEYVQLLRLKKRP